jgi:predicted transcriptional regulator
MRAVEHDGTRYLLVKRSGESSRVRDPATGEEQYLPNDELTPLDEGPLEAAAGAVAEPLRALVAATTDERALGLLVELANGPVAVRELMSAYDLCESDALGLVTEFRVAGLVSETTVGGERGYELTDRGETAIERLVR